MLISIISLTFNNEQELRETINSVPASDLTEIIVVNGGSGSYGPEIFGGRSGKIINEKDEGISDAFNKGVKNSSGEAIMFLNSGDYLLDDEYILKSSDILDKKKDISFIHSNLLFADELGGEIMVRPPQKNIGRGNIYLHPTMIVRKSVFEKIGFFSKEFRIAMDFDFIARGEKNNWKGFYLDIPPVVKMSGGGKSQSHEFDAIKECIHSLQKHDMMDMKNMWGVSVRLTFYFLRRLLVKSGGKNILGKLKKIKYN